MAISKTSWKGSISFGLVNIPVELYSAVKEHVIGFKILHAKCNNPITYKRWCSHCDQEVVWQDIVKGLKLKDGSYFTLTKENLKKLKPEKSDNLQILSFVDFDSIPIIYFGNHYYVVPQKETDRAFFLFVKALEKISKVALAKFIMKEKEHLCILKSYKNVLTLTILNYEYEIRKIDLDLKNIKIDDQELKLATLLIKKLEVQKFDITKYKDEFVQKLISSIEKKARGKLIKVKKEVNQKSLPTIIDSLKESLKK